MRLIGNKFRLVGEIEKFLRDRGVSGGTFLDVFSGTSSVGSHFKRLGFRVIANDMLPACHVQAVARIEVSRFPQFEGIREKFGSILRSRGFLETFRVQGALDLPLVSRDAGKAVGEASPPRRRVRRRAAPPAAGALGAAAPSGDAAAPSGDAAAPSGDAAAPSGDAAAPPEGGGPRSDPRPLREAVHLLERCVPPREGLIFRNYCPGGRHRRMYFSDSNGRAIDGMLEFLRENWREGVVGRSELHLLLSAVIDAADRVANISGTYGAYLKSWQRNALEPLRLEVPEVIESDLEHEAYREDSNALVRKVPADVMYVDPPYTSRQYAANYHVLDVIAEHHRIDDLAEYEASLYGKTGLVPYDHLKSAYCARPTGRSEGKNVLVAMSDLILHSRARHVLVSYNEEGLLTRDELGSILGRFSGRRSFDFERGMRTVLYRRFRSDGDRPEGHGRGKRVYKVLEGKERNQIAEWLLFASKPRGARSAPRRAVQDAT